MREYAKIALVIQQGGFLVVTDKGRNFFAALLLLQVV